MLRVSPHADSDWLALVAEAVRYEGCAVVTDVLAPELVARTRDAMYDVQRQIREELGPERLAAAGEIGVLRLMARYDAFFLRLIVLPEMLAILEQTVSATAILHLQNGFILPPSDGADAAAFQRSFHRDFPRHLNGHLASINMLLALDPFAAHNGATLVVPGTQHEQSARTRATSPRRQSRSSALPGR